MLLIKNDAYSTLAVDLLATDTSISLVAGTGDRFPVVAEPDYAYATLQNAQGRKERIKIVARASGEDVMTIVRAQDDSAARFWAAGDLIECRASAAVLKPLQVLEGAVSADEILGKLGTSSVGLALLKAITQKAGRTALGASTLGDSIFIAATAQIVRDHIEVLSASQVGDLLGGKANLQATTNSLNALSASVATKADATATAAAIAGKANTLVIDTSTVYGTNATHNIAVSADKKLLLMVSYNGGNASNTSVYGNFAYGLGALSASRTFANGGVDYQTPFGFSMQAILQPTGSANLQVRMNTTRLDGGYGAPGDFFVTVIEI